MLCLLNAVRSWLQAQVLYNFIRDLWWAYRAAGGGKLIGGLKENVSKCTDKKYVKTDKVQYQDAFSISWSLIQLLNNQKKKQKR